MKTRTAAGISQRAQRAKARVSRYRRFVPRALVVGLGLWAAVATGSASHSAEPPRAEVPPLISERASDEQIAARPSAEEQIPVEVLSAATETRPPGQEPSDSLPVIASAASSEATGCTDLAELSELPTSQQFIERWNAGLIALNEPCAEANSVLETKSWTIERSGPSHIGTLGSQFGLIDVDDSITRIHFAIVSDDTLAGATELVHALVSDAFGVARNHPAWGLQQCDSEHGWVGQVHRSTSGGSSISVDVC